MYVAEAASLHHCPRAHAGVHCGAGLHADGLRVQPRGKGEGGGEEEGEEMREGRREGGIWWLLIIISGKLRYCWGYVYSVD